MISSEKSEIPNKRGLLRVMLLFFCIVHQVIHGIVVIIMRIVFVSCDIVTKFSFVYGRGTVSWTRPVNNVDGNTNRGPDF